MRFTVNLAFEEWDDTISSFNTTLPNPAKSIVVLGEGNALITVPATTRFTTVEPLSLDCRVPSLLLVVLTAVISSAAMSPDSTLTLWMSELAVAMFSALEALVLMVPVVTRGATFTVATVAVSEAPTLGVPHPGPTPTGAVFAVSTTFPTYA